jgi:hypothetical protein
MDCATWYFLVGIIQYLLFSIFCIYEDGEFRIKDIFPYIGFGIIAIIIWPILSLGIIGMWFESNQETIIWKKRK